MHEYAHSPESRRAQAYWQERLSADGEPLLFYGETPRKTTTAAERVSRTLTPGQMQRLDALAARAGRFFPRTTTFAIFVSVLSVFLYRVSGTRSFCIGIPFHNRRTPALRDTLGLVMQVVPLTIRIDDDDTFLSLLKRIEAEATESWQHAQHTIPNSLHQPTYDAVLNFHSPLDVSMGGAPVRAVFLHPGHQVESLGIHVQDLARSGALTLDFDLHGEVFPTERRELVVSQFLRVLDSVLENPRKAVAGINLLSADEERRLLVDLNSVRLPLPERLTCPALFEAQAEKTPAAVAVVYEARLAPELADRLFEHSKAELYNVYGQTETCISVTHWRCRAGASARTISVGHPHANTQVYILDPALRPVPVGVPGELYLGGAGVARGYLNRPGLTAERFVPNPFYGARVASATGAGSRLFKTGDLARFTSDGTIECLGRIDRQVKIRGNLVELGEIEAVLSRHPGVRDCVVRHAQARTPGGRAESRLVAYLVSEAPIRVDELRSLCRHALPGFMVPAAFVRLDALPHASSGKVDERKLPPPEAGAQERPDDMVEPRDLAEEIVAGIWADVLDVESVSQRRRELLRRRR